MAKKTAVIPAGERWKEDGSLRPSLEDLIGAGAIISHLSGSRSPEAQLAASAFEAAETLLENALRECGSGKELIQRGFENDVILASKLNISECTPVLNQDAYIRAVV